VGKLNVLVMDRETLELAFRALDDAYAEIEAFEKDAKWYTASQKMVDRMEDAMLRLQKALK
jgi:chaperonin cofactor prefoldin